jgi:hypothetical protein
VRLGIDADTGAPFRNRISASAVACGLSSMIQWPVFGSTTDLAFVATSFTCSPRAAPFALSPPIESTGIVSLVCDSRAKSVAAC